jgi:hypothetical protein
MTKVLDRRALNRALLARQHLLTRADISVPQALHRLIALQAQAGPAPYFALWNRLRSFAPEDLSVRLEDLGVARGTLMRGTLHVATAADFAAIRPLIQRGLDRFLTEAASMAAPWRGWIRTRSPRRRGEAVAPGAAHRDATARGAGGALARPGSPGSDDGRARPFADAATAAARPVGARRPADPGGDGRSAPNSQAGPDPGRLGAALPGGVRTGWRRGRADLARPQPVGAHIRALRASLVVFHDEDGQELFDLPDADRPSGEVEAPVRLLGEFDNVLLAHEDRTRIMSAEHRRRLYTPNGILRAAVLVDGFTAGRWRIEDGKAESILRIELFETVAKAVTRTMAEEGERLLAFAAKHAARDIRIELVED